LKWLRHWCWKTRKLEWVALGGRPLGNRNLLRRADSDYVLRRFEPEWVRMLRAGHLRQAKREVCFEWPRLNFVVENALDAVHRRIAHPLWVSFWRGWCFEGYRKIRAIVGNLTRNSKRERLMPELAVSSALSLWPQSLWLLSLRPVQWTALRRVRSLRWRNSALFPVMPA
jgi:hypothetical protein